MVKNYISGGHSFVGDIIGMAVRHLDKDEFIKAKGFLEEAIELDPNNDFIRQKLALATYKSKYPDHHSALKEALGVLDSLNLEKTTDPETLGLAGAIFKRLWEELGEKGYLEKSISYYQRGYIIKKDYYNGINLAFLHNLQASIQENCEEAIADYILANRIRKNVVSICLNLYHKENFSERSDKYWILATLEEAFYCLNDIDNYNIYKERAQAIANEKWQRETTELQISKLKELISKKPQI